MLKFSMFRNQSGHSLMELLLVIALAGLVLGGLATWYIELTRSFRLHASRTILIETMDDLRSLQAEDIRSSGMGSRNLADDRLLAQDLTTKQSCPAVFFDDSTSQLTAIQTNLAGSATLFSGAGTSQLILTQLNFEKWKAVDTGSLLMAVNPTGPPVLLRVNATPRKANADEIPATVGYVNLDRTLSVTVSTVVDCGGLATLSNTPVNGADILQINRIIKYSLNDQKGIVRYELTGCRQSLGPISGDLGRVKVELSPGLQAVQEFSYLTTAGPVQKLPGDLHTLRGIRTHAILTDPATGYKEEATYDIPVTSWK
ncbi:MAG TPA: prepilin-type N-terminal cleavage/methylation domain-containing protein [Acidobacteriota bacterium]|nr:prepilin-type N-terminal cleavage/methylation domain-containing protein [Acidobacteriota bacterium]